MHNRAMVALFLSLIGALRSAFRSYVPNRTGAGVGCPAATR
jgi:hypothetical protein